MDGIREYVSDRTSYTLRDRVTGQEVRYKSEVGALAEALRQEIDEFIDRLMSVRRLITVVRNKDGIISEIDSIREDMSVLILDCQYFQYTVECNGVPF